MSTSSEWQPPHSGFNFLYPELTMSINANNILITGGNFNHNNGDADSGAGIVLWMAQSYFILISVLTDIQKIYEYIAKDAFHNSQERSEEANLQAVNDIAREWTARLRRMSTLSFVVPPSSTSDSRNPLFAALVLEDVIKDIFIWLHDPSTHCLAMWVYDDDRSWTSLIGQAVAKILAKREELSAM